MTPQVGLSHSSSLPQQQLAYPKGSHPGSYQSPINSRGASPSRFDKNPAPQVSLSHSSSLPQQQYAYPQGPTPGSYQSPISSRGASPSRFDKNPAPQVGLSHSSSLPQQQCAYPQGPTPGSYQSPINSRGSSPSRFEKNPAPPIGLSHSSSLPTKQQSYPHAAQTGEDPQMSSPVALPSRLDRNPGPEASVANSSSLTHQEYLPYPGSKPSCDPSPSYLDRSHLRIHEAQSSSLPGQQFSVNGSFESVSTHPHSETNAPGLNNSASPRALSPSMPADPEMLNRGYNPQPIGGRVLRDHVPKLYASEATPPGGMYVPVDYLEGSKSKPVDGKLLREPVLGVLATSTIVPEALKVLPPSSVESLRADDSSNEQGHRDSQRSSSKANSQDNQSKCLVLPPSF